MKRVLMILLAGVAAVWADRWSPLLAEIKVPPGFRTEIFADTIAPGTRHIVMRDNGMLYARVRNGDGGVYGLYDSDKDGTADKIERFGKGSGTGITIYNNYLYYSTDSEIYRQKLLPGALKPDDEIELVVKNLTDQDQHEAKSIAIDKTGRLYVNIGAPSNACQEQDRKPGSPGQRPCKLLEYSGGIWRFSAEKLDQDFKKDGERYATGVRNAVALAWNDALNQLYLVQHGRDQLSSLYPEHFTAADNAELPAEEFHLVKRNSNLGWPYTYYDQIRNKRMVAPEYGGDGATASKKEYYESPLVAFPGHWAPNGLIFYEGKLYPERYKRGAFIAFHGSWNRAPHPQAGYLVAFVPYNKGSYSTAYEIFADKFKGDEEIGSPGQAAARPMGLAVGPEGALYISDSKRGRVWKVTYTR